MWRKEDSIETFQKKIARIRPKAERSERGLEDWWKGHLYHWQVSLRSLYLLEYWATIYFGWRIASCKDKLIPTCCYSSWMRLVIPVLWTRRSVKLLIRCTHWLLGITLWAVMLKSHHISRSTKMRELACLLLCEPRGLRILARCNHWPLQIFFPPLVWSSTYYRSSWTGLHCCFSTTRVALDLEHYVWKSLKRCARSAKTCTSPTKILCGW